MQSDHDEQKTNPSYKFLLKNKLVESTDHEAGMSDATSTEVWSQNSDEGSGSKAEMSKFHDVWNSRFLWLIYDSSNNVIFAERQAKILPAKPNLLPERKNLNKKVLFIK